LPTEQGLISMNSTFIDSLIICSLTDFPLILSDAWQGNLNGDLMTQSSFESVLPSKIFYPEEGYIEYRHLFNE
jgi:AGCS family alanine or glycine:cation symporter